jgi:hypothetical protein
MAESTVKVRTVQVRKRVTVRNGRRSRTVERCRTVRTEKRTSKPEPIVVTLPDVPAIPGHLRGTDYAIRVLLTDGEDNPKLARSNGPGRPTGAGGCRSPRRRNRAIRRVLPPPRVAAPSA